MGLLSAKYTYRHLVEKANPWVAEGATDLVIDREHSWGERERGWCLVLIMPAVRGLKGKRQGKWISLSIQISVPETWKHCLPFLGLTPHL